jgi:hypothetical protein
MWRWTYLTSKLFDKIIKSPSRSQETIPLSVSPTAKSWRVFTDRKGQENSVNIPVVILVQIKYTLTFLCIFSGTLVQGKFRVCIYFEPDSQLPLSISEHIYQTVPYAGRCMISTMSRPRSLQVYGLFSRLTVYNIRYSTSIVFKYR